MIEKENICNILDEAIAQYVDKNNVKPKIIILNKLMFLELIMEIEKFLLPCNTKEVIKYRGIQVIESPEMYYRFKAY